MKMKYTSQENEVYNANIRKSGCYLLSLLKIIEELNSREFEHTDVHRFYSKFLEKKWILANCRVENPDSIFAFFGTKVKTKKETCSYKLEKNDLPYFVSHIKTNFFTGHFVLCKGIVGTKLDISNKIWDSLFLTKNSHKLCQDAFRVFSKV